MYLSVCKCMYFIYDTRHVGFIYEGMIDVGVLLVMINLWCIYKFINLRIDCKKSCVCYWFEGCVVLLKL